MEIEERENGEFCMGTEKREGTDFFKLQRVRKMYGTKVAKFLVRVRGRVRVTFSFVSTGTDSVPVTALRGMISTQFPM